MEERCVKAVEQHAHQIEDLAKQVEQLQIFVSVIFLDILHKSTLICYSFRFKPCLMITSPTLIRKIASGVARKIAPVVKRRRLREPLSQTATPGISSMAGKHLLSLSAITLPVTVQASLNFSRSLQQLAPKIAPSTKADSQGSLLTITIRSTQPPAMRKCRSTLRTWSQNPDQFMAITGLKSSSLQSP